MDELAKERYDLAVERIREIREEKTVAEPYLDFFTKTAGFLEEMICLRNRVETGEMKKLSLEELRLENTGYYQDILPENYPTSYSSPDYAAKILGEELGVLLSFLYTELRGMIVYAWEQKEWDFLVGLELFLQVYSEFEGGEVPTRENVRKILYWYVNDYCQEMVEERIRQAVDPALDFAVKIIKDADLTDLRYLYQFGEYVTEEEEKTAAFLNTLPEEEITAMARTYTEGYRIGFIATGKDLSRKKTVNIRYVLGFERMIRAAITQFEQMGLQPVIYRSAVHMVNKGLHRIGYYGAIPNPQFDYDHRNDIALYLDDDFVSRKLRATRGAYETYKELAGVHAGPAVVEIFGERPFVPETCEYAMKLTEKQQKLKVHMQNEIGQITNRYIKGEERSFTIIAYPVPAIGDQFEEIFRETVKINTLDYNLYQQIQQKLIDALDLGTSVHILGKGENRTDLRVQLHKLEDPEKQTNFENCVADVNIPVGEVFTSPQLAGTNGLLHVGSVYIGEFQFKDLEIRFENGIAVSYTCKNFETEEENKALVKQMILKNHETLPMGEFAIGTNTTAYEVALRYGILDKFPILIAEKMGPHFAVGDTCYSWMEDCPVFNPDGREMVARENEISAKRKENPQEAYLGCHTDITIPYSELDTIEAIHPDGTSVKIIAGGRFALPGTEKLNEPLEK